MKTLLFLVLVVALVVPTLSFAGDLASDENYKAKCAACHGVKGEGKPAMRTQTLAVASGKSEADLTKIIEEGTTMGAMKMKGYKNDLKPEQIQALVMEIKSLK
jgi:mono/diheme cytochrome c family protein